MTETSCRIQVAEKCKSNQSVKSLGQADADSENGIKGGDVLGLQLQFEYISICFMHTWISLV